MAVDGPEGLLVVDDLQPREELEDLSRLEVGPHLAVLVHERALADGPPRRRALAIPLVGRVEGRDEDQPSRASPRRDAIDESPDPRPRQDLDEPEGQDRTVGGSRRPVLLEPLPEGSTGEPVARGRGADGLAGDGRGVEGDDLDPAPSEEERVAALPGPDVEGGRACRYLGGPPYEGALGLEAEEGRRPRVGAVVVGQGEPRSASWPRQLP